MKLLIENRKLNLSLFSHESFENCNSCSIWAITFRRKAFVRGSGKPLFWYVNDKCTKAGFNNKDIVLATDDNKILDKAREFNIEAVMTSSSHESGTDRLNEVSSIMG